MLFYDSLFLTLFPVLYVLYLAIHNSSIKKWILLIASFLFYAWGEPLFVPVLMASTFVDYLLAPHLSKIADNQNSEARRQFLLAVGVGSSLALLVLYKYSGFLVANLNGLLTLFGTASISEPKIALPIGVSFIVFEKITYLVDTYRGISRPAKRFSDYCLFVLFFPKLLAGPILKYHEIEKQIAAPPAFAWEDFWIGFTRFAQGIFKKVIIADPLGACADSIFGADPWSIGYSYAWLGIVCFTLQIYFDFSGYSDMAIGLARMFGFRLRENFNMPYISQSLTEFWQRWHISLTTWIRDYLYIPLGGNRISNFITYRNLWICFLFSGLWHGASWNFILWGAYNGLFLTLDRIFLRASLRRSGAIVGTTVTLLIVMLGWVIFRSPNISHLSGYMAALAGFTSSTTKPAISGDIPFTIALGALLSLLPATSLYPLLIRAWKTMNWPRIVANFAFVAMYIIALARAITIPFQPFIYFRF